MTQHYENFPVASLLLPSHLRHAVQVIYQFARTADDLADEGNAAPAERLAGLAAYRHALDQIGAGTRPAPPFAALAVVIQTHQLPLQPFYDLLSAFAQDVTQHRYADLAELENYCQRSANPIGRLLLVLYQATAPQLLPWADALCTGLQKVNFWQDVAVDWAKGRVYLPQNGFAQFGLTEQHIPDQLCNAAWQTMLGHWVQDARQQLRFSAPLAHQLSHAVAAQRGGFSGWWWGLRLRLEIRLMQLGGLRLLEKIEAVHYDVFRHRPTLHRLDWLCLCWRAVTMRLR